MTAELWAWMADDQNGPGVPGIISAGTTRENQKPLVVVQEHVARRWQPFVEDIARQSGVTVRLVRFTQAEEAEVIRRG